MAGRGDRGEKTPVPTVALVMWRVASFYGVTVEDIRGYDRSERVRRPRQVAMHLAMKLCQRSTRVVGREFRRDHKTVIRAVRALQECTPADGWGAEEIERVETAVCRGVV